MTRLHDSESVEILSSCVPLHKYSLREQRRCEEFDALIGLSTESKRERSVAVRTALLHRPAGPSLDARPISIMK